jgi:hypothetical protein
MLFFLWSDTQARIQEASYATGQKKRNPQQADSAVFTTFFFFLSKCHFSYRL